MTTTAALPVTIDLPEFAHLDPTVGWHRRLVLCPDRRLVEVRESVGNGVPEREWQGLDIVLAVLPLDLADGSRIAAYLESARAQTLLAGLCDDTLTNGDDDTDDEWSDARDELDGCVLAECDESPKYWEAGDFFQHNDADDLFDVEQFDGTDAALEQRAHDLCAEAAQDGHRLVVSEVRRHLDRVWADAVEAVRERLCDEVAGADEDGELFDGADMESLGACVESLFALWPSLDHQSRRAVRVVVAPRYEAFVARRAEVAP